MNMRGSKGAKLLSQNGGMAQNIFDPQERREKSAERSEKRERERRGNSAETIE